MEPTKLQRALSTLDLISVAKREIELNKKKLTGREYYRELAKISKREDFVNAIILHEMKTK